MNILRQLRPFFDASVRSRGDSYDRENRVELESVEPGRVSAQIEGSSSRYYSVRLKWEDEDPLFLLGTCTCPHYQTGEFCKHLWATLKIFHDGFWELECDERQVILQHGLDLDEAYSFDGQSPSTTSRGSAQPTRWAGARVSHSAGARAAERERRSKASGWAGILNAASATGTDLAASNPVSRAAEAEREMWLLVDPERSRRSGALIVDLFFRQRRRDGTFGKIRREGVCRADIFRYPDPEDRRLLSLLVGSHDLDEPVTNSQSSSAHARQRTASVRVPRELHALLLDAMCATGRLVWPDREVIGKPSPPHDSLHSLGFDDGAPWQFELRVEPEENYATRPDTWTMSGHLIRGAQRVAPSAAVVALDDGLLIFKDKLSKLESGADAAWINAFSEVSEQRIERTEADAFLSQWWTLRRRPKAKLPAEFELDAVVNTPRGCVSVAPIGHGLFLAPGDQRVSISFVYGQTTVESDSPIGAVADLKARQYIPRDPDRERELLEQAHQLGVRWHDPEFQEQGWHSISSKRVDSLSHALLDDGWLVEVEGAMLRSSTGFDLTVSSGIDWFDLEAEVNFGDQRVDLPALLGARAAGERHIRLADGTVGVLPEAWLDKYDRIAALGNFENGRLRMRHTQATMIDALLRESESSSFRVDERFRKWRERLSRVDGVPPCVEPASFKGELRPYQRVGLGWLRFLDDIEVGGCLADDMGLGKTVQIIALLLSRVERNDTPMPSIVVVPRSLVWNWRAELARFAPSLAVLEYGGTKRHNDLDTVRNSDVVVTTYGTLRRDIHLLRDIRFDYAILDEAQAIKNAKSQAAKAARLLDARQRLAVTGTPIENHLGELWSLFDFLNPGLLGSSAAFDTIARGNGRTSTEATQTLSTGLRPFILRRTKQEVLPDLPAKTEQTLYCKLPPEQRELYNELRDYYRRLLDEKIEELGLGRSKIHVLEALLRLRQTACHPGLVDPSRTTENSAKLSLLLERLDDVVAEGHKALVFSQFTKLLAIVRDAVEARGISYEYLDGKTRDREQRVAQFQDDPDCSLFLISLKAGGHGLNLTAADYVFILDPWWNPAVEAQAIDRAHRFGQKRSVFAYRLIAEDTVEEKIVQLQSQKRALADAIVAADETLMQQLKPDDLSVLLG